uniref:Uncharacterized protein n=1 Tax=Zea mays TaxID=4577 RepID=C0P9F3_MAIZE|nr:unknown [Zea mays]
MRPAPWAGRVGTATSTARGTAPTRRR